MIVAIRRRSPLCCWRQPPATAARPSRRVSQSARLQPKLLDPIARLLRLLDRPDDVAVLGPMLEREILWRLLTGEQGGTVRQIGLADSRLSQVSRAIRWIRAHYAETLRIEDLAQVAGMSASSFHRHFRAVTANEPASIPEADSSAGSPRGFWRIPRTSLPLGSLLVTKAPRSSPANTAACSVRRPGEIWRASGRSRQRSEAWPDGMSVHVHLTDIGLLAMSASRQERPLAMGAS
jgi:hypothetical protein